MQPCHRSKDHVKLPAHYKKGTIKTSLNSQLIVDIQQLTCARRYMEQIIIQGLQLPTLIGVYDWERTQKTILLVDLVLDADLSRACETDDVADTIDYAKVAEALAEVAGKAKFELLEALGQALCDCVLTRFPVTRVDLSIIKPDILPNAAKVAVRLVRESR